MMGEITEKKDLSMNGKNNRAVTVLSMKCISLLNN
jgi:hypothetical protein